MPARGVLWTRANLSGLVILTLFVGLVVYSWRIAPDWMFMYFVRGSDVPGWLVVYILDMYYAAYLMGFLAKFELARLHRALPPVFLVLMLVYSVAVVLPLKDRYWNVGTLEQFTAGETVPLPKSPVGKVPGNLTLVLVPLGVGLLVWSRRERRGA